MTFKYLVLMNLPNKWRNVKWKCYWSKLHFLLNDIQPAVNILEIKKYQHANYGSWCDYHNTLYVYLWHGWWPGWWEWGEGNINILHNTILIETFQIWSVPYQNENRHSRVAVSVKANMTLYIIISLQVELPFLHYLSKLTFSHLVKPKATKHMPWLPWLQWYKWKN